MIPHPGSNRTLSRVQPVQHDRQDAQRLIIFMSVVISATWAMSCWRQKHGSFISEMAGAMGQICRERLHPLTVSIRQAFEEDLH
jgi:hypothetical protein